MSIQIANRKLSALFIGFVIILLASGVFGSFKLWKKYQRNKMIGGEEITLSEAAKKGEVSTHKLMVQIESPRGNLEDAKGRYQRGDIVLIKPGNFEFSGAEKAGFLIFPMDLTEKQSELLVRSLQKDTGKDDPDGRPQLEDQARRRYSVDLAKIGISPDRQTGGEITGQVFSWSAVREKE
jgi:hypothetical protein